MEFATGAQLEHMFLSNVLKIQIEEYKRILKFGNVQFVIMFFFHEEGYNNIAKMSILTKLKVNSVGIIQY